jgi:hypothetical protein
MARPTIEHVGNAQDLLYVLADKDSPMYYLVASLIDVLVWVDHEVRAARDAASYGPGSDAHTIGRHGLNRPTEDRLDFGTDVEDEATGARPRRRGRTPERTDLLPVEVDDWFYKRFKRMRREWYGRLAATVGSYESEADEIASYLDPSQRAQKG